MMALLLRVQKVNTRKARAMPGAVPCRPGRRRAGVAMEKAKRVGMESLLREAGPALLGDQAA
jgi:hypothetical protein